MTVACAATLVSVGAPAQAATAPVMHTIDLAVPGTDGAVVDVNRSGVVVGSFRDADGDFRSVLWRQSDPTVLGAGLGAPNALNDVGDVVGGDWLWRRGTVRHLEDPTGLLSAGSVNNRDQIAGSRSDAAGLSTAFRWQNGRFTDVTATAGWHTWPTGLNQRGDMIGELVSPDFSVHRGFIWRDGTLTVIDAFGGDTAPRAVNDLGEVVGSATVAGSSVSHPFRWARGAVTDLMAGRPDERGTANDINNAGDVVGHAADRPALWRAGRTVLIGPGGSSRGGAATAVNDRGDVAGVLALATSDEDRTQWAFRWRSGALLLSEPITGEGSVSVAGVDQRGRLAGTIRDGAGGSRAVVWRP